MSDLMFLFEAFVVIAATALPIIVIVRLIAGDAQAERPTFVREDEPPHWNVGSAA